MFARRKTHNGLASGEPAQSGVLARRAAAACNPLGALRPPAALVALGLAAVALGACGTQGNQIASTSPYHHGAELFLQRCSGCHSLATVGAQGSAVSIKDRVRTNGPNFNFRKEQYNQVMYAIRNGGFSGAIMPQNIVVGREAEEVARFLAKYAGLQAQKVPSIENTAIPGASSSTTATTGTPANATATAPATAASPATATAPATTSAKHTGK